MGLLRRPVDQGVLKLFKNRAQRATRKLLLRDMLADFPERATLARDLLLFEREGDRVAHDIIHRLNGSAAKRQRPLFASADVYELARTLDDIVDYTEQTGDSLGLYGVAHVLDGIALKRG